MNPEIWSRISNTGQRQYLKLVAIQKTLVAVGTAVTKAAQLLMDARQHDGIRRREGDKNNLTNEVLTLQVDALALLGHTNYELSLRRREMMKPSLNKDYASLCSSQTSVSSMLFGDELQSQLNSIRASNRISRTATQSGQVVTTNRLLIDVQGTIVRNLFYPKAPTPGGRTTGSSAIRKSGKGATRSDYY